MKRQRQRVTEKDSVERANESEKVGAGRRRGALLELYACLSRAVTWVKCPEDVGTRAQPERWHQVQSISWVEECRWSKVTRGAVLNGRKCIHLHNLLIVELIYSWNMLKIQQDYSFPNVGICYFSWFFFLPVFFTTAAAWLFWCHAAGESVLLPLWSWLEYLNNHWMDCQFWTGTLVPTCHPVTLSLAPLWGWILRFGVKRVKMLWMHCNFGTDIYIWYIGAFRMNWSNLSYSSGAISRSVCLSALYFDLPANNCQTNDNPICVWC